MATTNPTKTVAPAYGIHRLIHRTNPRSIFTVAGLNFEHIFDGDKDLRGDRKITFEPRNAPIAFAKISETEAELHQPPTPTFHLESWTRFKLVAPHYIDFSFRCFPRLRAGSCEQCQHRNGEARRPEGLDDSRRRRGQK